MQIQQLKELHNKFQDAVIVLAKMENTLAQECALAKKEENHAFLAIHHLKEIV